MDSAEEERLHNMRENKKANKTITNTKTCVIFDLAVILFSFALSHLIHLPTLSTATLFNNRLSTHLTTRLLCWELGCGATERARGVGENCHKWYTLPYLANLLWVVIWLYHVLHIICKISKIMLWFLRKKNSFHMRKRYLVISHRYLERISFFFVTWLWWRSNTHGSRCG